MVDVWVTNTSPLVTLAKVGQLQLLAEPDVDLWIPDAVVREVLAGPIPRGTRQRFRQAGAKGRGA